MFKLKLENSLKKVVVELGYSDVDVVCNIPKNSRFGDYSTNIALQMAKHSSNVGHQSPNEIANSIVDKIKDTKASDGYLAKVDVASNGFINFYLDDQALIANLASEVPSQVNGKRYLVEYAQPNTHKAFHIGHLRNISLGESIARMLQWQGRPVFRATYGSDIGLPVAKAVWGIKQLADEYQEVSSQSVRQKAEFLGKAYALGATAYVQNQDAKAEIDLLNQEIYARNGEVHDLWSRTRGWSIEYFESLYQRLGTKFDGQFWESEVEDSGKQIVLNNLDKFFEKSDGAIIFPGEKYGLHTRVFITSQGFPTYEAKELGLTDLELEKAQFDIAIHVVANEQTEYFKVVIKVIELLYPHLKGRKIHLPYGFVHLKQGKMSSRSGNVVTADWLLDEIKKRVETIMTNKSLPGYEQIAEAVSLGAIKFGMLKFSPNTDIFFDIDTAISLQGDSGPYLQYTYARICSVLEKGIRLRQNQLIDSSIKINQEERQVLLQIEYFADYLNQAALNLKPNIICEQLLNLAREFNVFYQAHRIVGSEQEVWRLALVDRVGQSLKLGLHLLGIEALERM